MRAFVYLRISQDRVGLAAGVERQREDCERRAAERDWTIVETGTDNDISATTGRHRPGFEAMLTAINGDRVDVVIAWAVDRLQRSRRDELRLYEACRDNGVVLSLVNGPEIDFATAAGRFVADSLGSVARFEVELKSDRQKRQVQQAASQGRRLGGRTPFGYEADGTTIREDQAAALRAAYTAVLTGVSLGEIARSWNAQGFTTNQIGHKSGAPGRWTRNGVRGVLLNPRNAGKRAHLGEIVAEAEWPAIIDESTYEAVRATLQDPARRRAPMGPRNLLSGLALCGVCGATVHGGGGVRRGVRNYRCTASTGHVGRMAQPVEDYVSAVIVERLSRPDAAELLVDRDKPDLDKLRAEAVALRSRLDTAAGEYADGQLTSSQLRTITERIRTRLSEVEGEMADAGRLDVLGPLISAADVRTVWTQITPSSQRLVIDTLMTVRIDPPGRGTRTFRPESVRIEWKA